jgi:hypothetical protein
LEGEKRNELLSLFGDFSFCQFAVSSATLNSWYEAGNTTGGIITLPLTSCLIGLESAV